ncbi:hypothetical protein [Gemmatimonas sp.]|uniref:hypothetical protein n=1 Tax=Gemmatimonas sp. TaxID=1962908 RepID=UPI00286D82CD|nr:hypothetical protein [Gemmatimonas sp.]
MLPGTFEHAPNHLLDREVHLASFYARFNNDATCAPGYPPVMRRKVVHSEGIVRGWAIERVSHEQVRFIASCAMTAPHFTTITHFVSSPRDDIAHVFRAVLAVFDGHGLIPPRDVCD